MVDNASIATVLVTDKITRTCKLLCAMAKGMPIVSPQWLLAIQAENNNIISPDEYILSDPDTEKRFAFTLKKSLEMARLSPILQNCSIFVTPNVVPPPGEISGNSENILDLKTPN